MIQIYSSMVRLTQPCTRIFSSGHFHFNLEKWVDFSLSDQDLHLMGQHWYWRTISLFSAVADGRYGVCSSGAVISPQMSGHQSAARPRQMRRNMADATRRPPPIRPPMMDGQLIGAAVSWLRSAGTSPARRPMWRTARRGRRREWRSWDARRPLMGRGDEQRRRDRTQSVLMMPDWSLRMSGS